MLEYSRAKNQKLENVAKLKIKTMEDFHYWLLKYTDKKEGKDWAYNVVSTSADYMVGGYLPNYFGALNVHGLHHLFPAIHPSHLEYVYHIYEKKCKEFDYPLTKLNSWKEVFSAYHETLYILGNFE